MNELGHIVESEGKYGVISFSGEVVVPCVYDEIYEYKGYLVIRHNGKKGVYLRDNLRRFFIEPIYDDIAVPEAEGDNLQVLKDETWGLIERNGSFYPLPDNPEEFDFEKSFIGVEFPGLSGLMD